MDFYDGLKKWEGSYDFMYLDTVGLVTTGVGNLLKTADDACELPWNKPDGEPATEDEIRQGWEDVKGSKAGLRATAYKSVCGLRLADDDVKALVDTRLENEFLPGLRKLVPGFEDYPEPCQECLVDLAYNLGLRGLGKFGTLLAAVRSRSWLVAAKSCSVKSSRPERNAWRKAKMEECEDLDS